MENKLQNLKFRVYSEAHSKAIQEKLFELDNNLTWGDGSRDINYNNMNYIFYYKDGTMLKKDDNEIYFNNHKNTLCTLDDLYKMQSEPNPQSELMTKLESLQKQLDSVKEEISKLNK